MSPREYPVVEVEEGGSLDLNTVDLHDRRVAERTCGLHTCGLSRDSAARQAAFSLSQSKALHTFIYACIFYNIIVMVLATDVQMRDAWFSQFYLVSDSVVTSIFTVEVLIGMLAHGVVMGRYSFVRASNWNRLDLVVVVTSWLHILPIDSLGNLGFLRAFRVLRIVRAMKGFTGIRKILAALAASLEMLQNVLTLSFFSFYLFAVFGLNMFMGRLGGNPYATVGGSGSGIVAAAEPGGVDDDGALGSEFEFANFDNIFAAVLTIFRAVSMEGWTTLCYALMRQVDPDKQWLVVLYFVLLLLLVTHLVVNLFVAVICTQFAGYSDHESEAERAKLVEAMRLKEAWMQYDSTGEARLQTAVVRRILKRVRRTDCAADEALESLRIFFGASTEDAAAGAAEEGESWKLEQLRTWQNAPVRISVQVFSARDLKPMDRSGFADPYCVLRCGDLEQKTPTVKQTLHPDWGAEQVFEFTSKAGLSDILTIEVYDWDRISKDDPMGQVIVPVANMHGEQEWVELGPMKGCDSPEGALCICCRVLLGNESGGAWIEATNESTGKRQRFQTKTSTQQAAMERRTQAVLKGDPTLKRRCKVRALLVISHAAFDPLIIMCVVLNTAFLSMEYHGQDSDWTHMLATSERIFLAVFALEMQLKWVGLGLKNYFVINANRFDCFLVTVSLAEQLMILLAHLGLTTTGSALGPVSVLRCFRLLRVVRAMRSIGELRQIIELIAESSEGVMDCFILVIFVLVIFSLLGMQLFSEEAGEHFTRERLGQHFGTFPSSMLLLFQVLTGEDWVNLLEMGMSGTSPLGAATFFVAYYIFVVYVLLNIFIALIMDAFSVHDDIKVERQAEHFLQQYGRIAAREALEEKLLANGVAIKQKIKPQGGLVKKMVDKQAFKTIKQKILIARLGAPDKPLDAKQHNRTPMVGGDDGNSSQLVHCTSRNQEDDAGPSFSSCTLHVRGVDRDFANEAALHEYFKQYGKVIACTIRKRVTSGVNTSWALVTMAEPGGARRALDAHTSNPLSVLRITEYSEKQAAASTGAMSSIKRQTLVKIVDFDEFENMMKKVTKLTFNPESHEEFGEIEQRMRSQTTREKKEKIKSALQAVKVYDCLLSTRRLSKRVSNAIIDFHFPLPSRSTKKAGPRRQVYVFDFVVYSAIVANMVFLALDKPGLDPESDLLEAIRRADTVFIVIFTVEFVLKITAMGAISPGGYMRDNGNIFDSLLLVVMYFDHFAGNAASPGRAIRSLRALRPLRMINANESMALVMTLFVRSFPKIMHVIMLTVVFFLISAVLGINLFAGKLFRCTDDAVWGGLDCVGTTVVDGLVLPREWSVPVSNFDDVASGFLTLYEVATLEGWVDVMHNTMDVTDVGRQPQKDHNAAHALFFVVFISFGSFFVMNLLIAVYIDSFNQSRGTGLLTSQQIAWVEVKRLMYRIKPRRRQFVPRSLCRRRMHAFVTATAWSECTRTDYYLDKNEPTRREEATAGIRVDMHKAMVERQSMFDNGMIGVILLNSAALSCVWEGQSDDWQDWMRYVDLFFVVAYSFEVAIKIGGLGSHVYFRGYWNLFDLTIVFFSILDLTPVHDVVDTSIFQTMRLLRMFKLVRRMQGLRALVHTLFISLPAIFNLAALLLIVFFVYAVMGVQLFSVGPIATHGDYLNGDANFESFFDAMFLLTRVTTGEAWNGIMHDLERNAVCDGDDDRSMVWVARAYFISFYTVTAFVFMKLFIAVILDNFANCFNREGHSVDPKVLFEYRRMWYLLDLHASGRIPGSKLREFVRSLPPPLGQTQWPRAQLEMVYSQAIENSAKKGAPPHSVDFYELLRVLALRQVGMAALEFQERVLLYLEAYTMRQKVSATLIVAAVRGKLIRMRARRAAASSARRGSSTATQRLPLSRAGVTAVSAAAMAIATAPDATQQRLIHVRPSERTENPLHSGLRYRGGENGTPSFSASEHEHSHNSTARRPLARSSAEEQSRLHYRRAATRRLAQAMSQFADQLGRDVAAAAVTTTMGRGGGGSSGGSNVDYVTMV